MLNGVKVRRFGWPIYSMIIFAFQILITQASPMWSGIVVHKKEFRACSTPEKTHIGF
jgi:hypothetical protein